MPEGEAFCVFQVVEEAPGGCDNDVGFFAEGNGLGYHVHATNYYCGANGDEGAEGVERLGDLVG